MQSYIPKIFLIASLTVTSFLSATDLDELYAGLNTRQLADIPNRLEVIFQEYGAAAMPRAFLLIQGRTDGVPYAKYFLNKHRVDWLSEGISFADAEAIAAEARRWELDALAKEIAQRNIRKAPDPKTYVERLIECCRTLEPSQLREVLMEGEQTTYKTKFRLPPLQLFADIYEADKGERIYLRPEHHRLYDTLFTILRDLPSQLPSEVVRQGTIAAADVRGLQSKTHYHAATAAREKVWSSYKGLDAMYREEARDYWKKGKQYAKLQREILRSLPRAGGRVSSYCNTKFLLLGARVGEFLNR